MLVEMLLTLRSVSPQPPSAFWCAASQAMPAVMMASKRGAAAECFWTRERAQTAVAVERADVESSPVQWPCGLRSASRERNAVWYADSRRSASDGGIVAAVRDRPAAGPTVA